MAERWRVAVVLGGAAGVTRSGIWLCKREVAREMQERSGENVVVAGAPGDGPFAQLGAGKSPVSAYTGSRAAAEAAAGIARDVTARYGLAADVTLECWHPVKKQWVDGSTLSEDDLAGERDHQQWEDRRLSAETGIAQWRVRAELRTHRDTMALARRLSGDGYQVTRSWTSVMAGADSEGDACRLAEKVRLYAPPGADVHAERADTPVYTGEDAASAGPLDFPAL